MDGILRADAREHPVHKPNFGALGGHKGPDLSHEHNQHHLAQEGALAAHIRAGDDTDELALFQNRVVGDEALVLAQLFHYRVAPGADFQPFALVQAGAVVIVQGRNRGQGSKRVQLAQSPAGSQQRFRLRAHLGTERAVDL